MDWFRSWHGAPTDNKWLVIARRANTLPGLVGYVFWALEDYASQNTDRGSVKGFDTEVCATYSGIDEDTVQAIIKALHDKGVITPDDRLAAWEKRQPKREDDSTERVRNWRNAQRYAAQHDNVDETQCNASVTQSNAPDTDTERDTEREEKNHPAPSPVDAPSVMLSNVRIGVTTATAGRREAARMKTLNAKLGAEVRRPLANVVLDITGTNELAATETDLGNAALYDAHEAAVTLYGLGYKTEPDLLALEPTWYQADFRGQKGERPTVKQLVAYAAKARAPVRQAAEARVNGGSPDPHAGRREIV